MAKRGEERRGEERRGEERKKGAYSGHTRVIHSAFVKHRNKTLPSLVQYCLTIALLGLRWEFPSLTILMD